MLLEGSNMFSMAVFKVLLSVYYVFAVVNASNFDFKNNVLVQPPNLAPLKDVGVWKNNLSITLQDILGTDIDKWTVDRDNSEVVADVAFTALCCSYSTNMMDFLDIYKTILACDDEGEQSISSKTRKHLSMYNDKVLSYLATVHHYSAQLGMDVDKNFMSSVLAISELLVQDDHVGNKTNTLKRNLNYIKYTIQSYNIEHCALPEKEVNDNLTCANFMLEEFVSNTVWCPSELLPTELVGLWKSFNAKDSVVSEVLEIELIAGNESTRLKHFKLNWSFYNKTLEQVYYEYVSGDFHLERRLKYHELIRGTVATIMLYIVLALIQKDGEHTAGTNSYFGANDTTIVSALNVLDGLGSTSLLRTALKELRFGKTFGSEKKYIISMAIEKYCRNSTVNKEDVAVFVQCTTDEDSAISEQRYSSDELSDMLNHFIRQIATLDDRFFKMYNTPNEMFDEHMQLLDIKRHIYTELQTNYQLFIADNCDMSSGIIRLFVLVDILVRQCERLVNDLKTVNNFQVLIVDNFSKMKTYIERIEYKFKQIFARVIKPVSINRAFIPINRKVVEAMYMISLYFNNANFHNVPLTVVDDSAAYLKTVAAKFEVLKRGHLNIINHLEHYINDHCPFLSPKDEYAEQLASDLNTYCHTSTSDRLNAVDCVGEKLKQVAGATVMPDFQTRLGNHYYYNDDYTFVHKTDDDNDCTVEVKHNSNSNSAEDYGKISEINVVATEKILNVLNELSPIPELSDTEEVHGDSSSHDSSDIEDLYYTYGQFFEPRYYLFGSGVQMSVRAGTEFSIINRLQTHWQGKITPIRDLRAIVSDRVNFKYVCEYQLLMLRVIVYIAFQKIKDVLIAMQTALAVWYHKTATIIKALNGISPIFLPSYIWILEEISVFLHHRTPDFDRHRATLVEVLEKEQISLGIAFEPTGPSSDFSTTLFDKSVEKLDNYSEEIKSINENIVHIIELMEWKNIVDATII